MADAKQLAGSISGGGDSSVALNSATISEFDKIGNIDWSKSNNYHVEFTLNPSLKRIALPEFKLTRDINLYIDSIATPDMTYQQFSKTQGSLKQFGQGDPNDLTFSITFRDSTQMDLYLAFLAIQRTQSDWYFDDYVNSIELMKKPDYAANSMGDKKMLAIAKYSDVMIDGISNLAINNNQEAELAKFTVRFKAGKILHKLRHTK